MDETLCTPPPPSAAAGLLTPTPAAAMPAALTGLLHILSRMAWLAVESRLKSSSSTHASSRSWKVAEHAASSPA